MVTQVKKSVKNPQAVVYQHALIKILLYSAIENRGKRLGAQVGSPSVHIMSTGIKPSPSERVPKEKNKTSPKEKELQEPTPSVGDEGPKVASSLDTKKQKKRRLEKVKT